METNGARIQLFINASFERIPDKASLISPYSIWKYLPKSFTARDDDLATAKHFLNTGDSNREERYRGHGPCHLVRFSGCWGQTWVGQGLKYGSSNRCQLGWASHAIRMRLQTPCPKRIKRYV